MNGSADSNSVISESVISGDTDRAYARRFQELIVYKKARQLAREVFNATSSFPKSETYALTDQLRRSARSVGAQISEAWAKRRYEKHFASKLTDADGEQMETQHWITVAFDCGYLAADETRRLGGLCLEVGRMLGSMIQQADQFCQDHPATLHEEATEFLCETPLTDD